MILRIAFNYLWYAKCIFEQRVGWVRQKFKAFPNERDIVG